MTENKFEINEKLVEQYLNYQREQERSYSTLQKYKHDLYALIEFLEGKELTKSALIDWKESLIDQYATACNIIFWLRGHRKVRMNFWTIWENKVCLVT